jgi:hypothetical protein
MIFIIKMTYKTKNNYPNLNNALYLICLVYLFSLLLRVCNTLWLDSLD